MGKMVKTFNKVVNFCSKLKNFGTNSQALETLNKSNIKKCNIFVKPIKKPYLPPASTSENIPRYLYTFTTSDNYASMMRDGVIKISTDQFSNGDLSGVFMVSLENFCKRWNPSSADWGNGSLITSLFNAVQKKGKGLVCLKIPTKALDKERMLIRSQNEYFKAKRGSGKYDLEHAHKGCSARYHRYLEQKEHAIEYIYPENIPTSLIASARQVNPSDIARDLPIGINAPQVRNLKILGSLFDGMPEMNLLSHIPEPQIIPLRS